MTGEIGILNVGAGDNKLVFDKNDGRLVMSLGSPGGPVIIHFVAKTLLGTLQWGLDAQRAIDLPNFGSLICLRADIENRRVFCRADTREKLSVFFLTTSRRNSSSQFFKGEILHRDGYVAKKADV